MGREETRLSFVVLPPPPSRGFPPPQPCPTYRTFQIFALRAQGCTGPVRYNPDCYSFHPSLISHFSFPTVTQTHRLIPPQGLSCLLCLDSIPPDHYMVRHLLCSCITQSSPPLSGISSPVCLALNIQETSQSWDVQSGNPQPFPRFDSLSVFCSEEKSITALLGKQP